MGTFTSAMGALLWVFREALRPTCPEDDAERTF